VEDRVILTALHRGGSLRRAHRDVVVVLAGGALAGARRCARRCQELILDLFVASGRIRLGYRLAMLRFRVLWPLLVFPLLGCPPTRGGGGGGDDDDAAPPELEFVNPTATCGEDGREGIEVSATNDAQVGITHGAFSEGCCPDLAISGVLDDEERTLTATYDLTNDICECVCSLDIEYGISGLPAGNWTLIAPDGNTAAFVVGAE
jgi:hypothetical protein